MSITSSRSWASPRWPTPRSVSAHSAVPRLPLQSARPNGSSAPQVGTQVSRGVSGGERKRTNIGMELIIDPSVLFLDEPTTGLDASTAHSVLLLLKRSERRFMYSALSFRGRYASPRSTLTSSAVVDTRLWRKDSDPAWLHPPSLKKSNYN